MRFELVPQIIGNAPYRWQGRMGCHGFVSRKLRLQHPLHPSIFGIGYK
jgi:hypothetical protein